MGKDICGYCEKFISRNQFNIVDRKIINGYCKQKETLCFSGNNPYQYFVIRKDIYFLMG